MLYNYVYVLYSNYENNRLEVRSSTVEKVCFFSKKKYIYSDSSLSMALVILIMIHMCIYFRPKRKILQLYW